MLLKGEKTTQNLDSAWGRVASLARTASAAPMCGSDSTAAPAGELAGCHSSGSLNTDLLGFLNLLINEVNTQLRTVGFITTKIVIVVVEPVLAPLLRS